MGQKIETSLLASALSLMWARFLHVESLDKETREKTLKDLKAKRAAGSTFEEMVAVSQGSRRREHHGNLYYRVYYTKDSPIGVGCLSDPLRRRLPWPPDATTMWGVAPVEYLDQLNAAVKKTMETGITLARHIKKSRALPDR